MIKKEHIKEMAKLLRFDEAAFTALLDDAEEKDIVMPKDITVLTAAELTSREETLKTRHEAAGMEIAIKNLKTDAGVEYQGKDGKKLIEAIAAKALKDANVDESAKVKELNTTIDGLRTNIANFEIEKQQLTASAQAAANDQELLTLTIDQKPDNLTNNQWLALIKLDNKIVDKDGVKVIERNGQVVVNKTDLKPLPVKDALVSFITESKIGKQEAAAATTGRGADDSKTPYLGIANMKQFNEHLKTEGISPNGDQAKQMLTEITTANTNFDFKTT